MKKVFLSTSFSGMVEEGSKEIVPEFRQFIEEVLRGLRRVELEVYTAIETEDWRSASDKPPEIGVQKDLDEIDSCDVLLALVGDKPSAGVQFELGYAVAKGKQVILARAEDNQLSYIDRGLISGGFVTLVDYDNVTTLMTQLTVAINAPPA